MGGIDSRVEDWVLGTDGERNPGHFVLVYAISKFFR